MDSGKFWLVWRRGNAGPTKKHDTYQSALDEAGRLASRHQEQFFVLSMVASVRPMSAPVQVSTWTE